MPGISFDELEVGTVFHHPIRRTVTEADNLLFSAMTHNPAQLHLDAEYRKGTPFGRPIMNSAFTLGLMVGISGSETTLGTAVANLGWDEVRFPSPLFAGDAVHVLSEVIALRESRSRPPFCIAPISGTNWSRPAKDRDFNSRNLWNKAVN